MAGGTRRIGEVQVTRVEEGTPLDFPAASFMVGYDADLFARHQSWMAPRFFDPATGMLRLAVQSWVVRTPRHTILIDTCRGNHKERPGRSQFHRLDTPWLEQLEAAAGVTPEQVDFVLCTHLHADHVGWNTRLADGAWRPTFPNARYVFGRREHEVWAARADDPAQPAMRRNTYKDSVLPIVEAGRAVLVEDDHEVDGCLTLVPTPGHTPGHVRIDLASGGERAVFAGDALHSPIQVPYWQWNSGSCEDGVQARASRRAMLEHCVEHRALLLPAHFNGPYTAHVTAEGDGFGLRFAD